MIARPPGGSIQPFQRGASKGSGIREVRANAPAATLITASNGQAIRHRGTTLAVATVSTSGAGTTTSSTRAPGQPPAGLFSMATSGKSGTVQIRIPANMTVTSATPATISKSAIAPTQVNKLTNGTIITTKKPTHSNEQLEELNILNEQQERDLEERCENRIKVGQFNSTAMEVKKIVENYRYRRLWFIGKGVYRVYLVCLAHTDPMGTLKELWNMEKHIKQQFGPRQPPWRLDADDIARILMIVIQDVPSIKKVVLTKKFHCPPDWPIMGPIATRPYKKLNDLMRGVFIVMISLIRSPTNHYCNGSVDLLMFAMRIFCPMWSHSDGNSLADMLKFYNQTKEINKELEASKTITLNFDAALKSAKIREKVDSSTTRVFCITFLLAKYVSKWEARHPQEIINLLAYPRTRYHELECATILPIWNFALFALCNQNEVAERMIVLDNYGLLNWFQSFLACPEGGSRYNVISNFLNIQVFRTIVLKSRIEFSIKFLDVLFNTISDFQIKGKLNMEAKRKYYDKYVDISAKFLDRVEKEIDEKAIQVAPADVFPGLKIPSVTPDWLLKLDYLEGLSYGMIDLMADRRAQLLRLCLYRKTTMARYYPNAKPVHVSFDLFGDQKYKNNFPIKYKFQSRLLGAFISSSVESMQDKVDPYLTYLIRDNTREDVNFLKALRMIQSCTKTRFVKRNRHTIDHKVFMKQHFGHVCDTSIDANMNVALILQTILMSEDDCIEQLHVTCLEYLSEILGNCCFYWLNCPKCSINNTKTFDERDRVGIDAFGKLLNRLIKIRHHKGSGPHFHSFETSRAMIKSFMAKFWAFFNPLAQIDYNKLSNNNNQKNLFNDTCHKYNILGKLITLIHQPMYPALNTAFSQGIMNIQGDDVFKGALEQFIFTMQNSNKFRSQPFTNFLRSRASGQPNIITLQPGIRVVQIHQVPINTPVRVPIPSNRPAQPPPAKPSAQPRKQMPTLTRKPPSPAKSCRAESYDRRASLSDDDYRPESEGQYVDMSNLGERKRTRFEHQKERELAFKKKRVVQRKLSESWREKRTQFKDAKLGNLEKQGYQFPDLFPHKFMSVPVFDPIVRRRKDLKKKLLETKAKAKEQTKRSKSKPVEKKPASTVEKPSVMTPVVPPATAPAKIAPRPPSPPRGVPGLRIIQINGTQTVTTTLL